MKSYVTIYEEYKHKFFQLPKVFFTSEKYKSMSNNAKIAWAILRDRSSLSKRNNWYDRDTGRIYFIFTNNELMNLLNINSKTTLSNIKKELEKFSLIENVRIGLNKPNKMYLLYPEITEDDIYKIEQFENYNYEEPTKGKALQTHSGQGCPENGRPENGRQEVQKMDSNNTDLNNTDLNELDTIDTENDILQILQNNHNEELKAEYIRKAFFDNEEKVPKELGDAFNVFCRNIEEAQMYCKAINKAKLDVFAYALKEKNTMLTNILNLENEPELLHKIVNTFVRVIRKIEKNQNINKPDSYLYKSVYKEIWNFYDLTTNETILQHNWLNET